MSALSARLSTFITAWLNGSRFGSPFGTKARDALIGDRLNQLADLGSTDAAKGASMIGLADAGSLFTAANVEAALAEIRTRLAAITTGNGASIVGVEDAGGYLAAANVEAALAEIAPYIGRQITDPGDAGAIPVTASGEVLLVTTGAQTRTVADPTKIGLMLTLHFLTDGGDCVVTFASPVNAAGNNTLTHDTAGEQVILQSCKDGASAFAWRVVANEAATPLSTV